MECLISVIIPVYNVENYISACVDSVLNQTLKNFEILLIDDGSTDRSAEICDNYAEEQKKVRVYHKSNGGLSDARNYGIDKAIGKYIFFLDSDDYIPSDALERLYDMCRLSGCRISMGNFEKTIETGSFIIQNQDYETKIIDMYDALELTFSNDGMRYNTAWGKLYERTLFDNGIRYPKGRNYEDIGTTYKLIYNAGNIVCTDAVVYYYYQSENSITRGKGQTKEKNLDDYIFMLNERIKGFYGLQNNELLEKLIIKSQKKRIILYCQLHNWFPNSIEKRNNLRRIIVDDYKLIKNSRCLSMKMKTVFFIFNMFPILFSFAHRIFGDDFFYKADI